MDSSDSTISTSPTFLRQKITPKLNVFYHSGDLGDIIYSLPFVASEGGGHLCIGCDHRTRIQFDAQTVELIAPLLRAQGYIASVTFVPAKPPNACDLTQIRNHWPELKKLGLNLVDSYFHVFKKPLQRYAPWLSAPEGDCPFSTLVHRSPRWNDPTWNWNDHVPGHAAFVGLPEEHAAFEAQFGEIEYFPTADLLVLAGAIKSCKTFMGNQSAPMAIAVGLGKPTVIEYWPEWPNIFT